ncbi:hypothetical protein VTN00DRAFT_52 [Thermoascus crustaceus]|uniref:uncharacterized protein n=1 Tax=Thermoascus crustaceus TaxID=5088 RepID=UPI003743F28B
MDFFFLDTPAAASLSSPVTYIVCSLPILYLLYITLSEKLQAEDTPKGCRRLGLPPGRSNLSDEFDPKYTHGVPPSQVDEAGQPPWRIKALVAYPIKSCAGIEFDVADVVPTGMEYDRQFCFAELLAPRNVRADASEERMPRWEFKTMRDGRFSRLALIRSEIWVPDPDVSGYDPGLEEVKSNGVLVIRYPRVTKGIWSLPLKIAMAIGLSPRETSFRVPLHPPADQISKYASLPVKLWKDFPLSYDYGIHIPQSLRDFLSPDPSSPPLTLFRVNPAHHRQIFRCAPRKSELGFQPVTGFADAYPLHLLNLTSVRDVARRCADAIPRLSVRQFRANIVVQGPGAYEEDAWKKIRVGGKTHNCNKCILQDEKQGQKQQQDEGIEIHTVCRTVRCRLPNVDPDTGIRHPSEPDKTLKSFRRIDRGDPTNACLGMQLVPAVERFTLRVGDPISVLETGEHFYIKMLEPSEGAV